MLHWWLLLIYLEFKAHLKFWFWFDTPPIWFVLGQFKSYLTNKESGVLAFTITWPKPSSDSLEWVGPHSEGKAANIGSGYVFTSSKLLDKLCRWLPYEAGWENIKNVQCCYQNMATLYFCLLHNSMSYFRVLMSILLISSVFI